MMAPIQNPAADARSAAAISTAHKTGPFKGHPGVVWVGNGLQETVRSTQDAVSVTRICRLLSMTAYERRRVRDRRLRTPQGLQQLRAPDRHCIAIPRQVRPQSPVLG